jgi:hypothetical protein
MMEWIIPFSVQGPRIYSNRRNKNAFCCGSEGRHKSPLPRGYVARNVPDSRCDRMRRCMCHYPLLWYEYRMSGFLP